MTNRWLWVVCAITGFAASAPASAAVRQCRAPLAGVSVGQASEPMAKRAAVMAWTGKAAAIGLQFGNWRLADQRMLKCVRTPNGKLTFDCVAAATPCTIVQNPQLPGPRGQPRSRKTKRGAAIET
jgi:hypothetical protein